MSIRPIDGPSRSYDDYAQNADTAKPRAQAKEFSFEGAAYNTVHLPTGAMVTSKEAMFTADLENLQKKVGVLRAALMSPEMADALKKNGQALAALKQVGVAATGALRFAKDAAGAAAAVVAIPEDMATFASQFKAAIPTIGAAGAPVLAAALDVAKAATKLTTDSRMP